MSKAGERDVARAGRRAREGDNGDGGGSAVARAVVARRKFGETSLSD